MDSSAYVWQDGLTRVRGPPGTNRLLRGAVGRGRRPGQWERGHWAGPGARTTAPGMGKHMVRTRRGPLIGGTEEQVPAEVSDNPDSTNAGSWALLCLPQALGALGGGRRWCGGHRRTAWGRPAASALQWARLLRQDLPSWYFQPGRHGRPSRELKAHRGKGHTPGGLGLGPY